MLEVVDAVDARLRRQGQGRGGHAAQAQPARRGRRVLPGHGGDAAGRRRPRREVGHALPAERRRRPGDHQRAGRAERPRDRAAGGGHGRRRDHRLAHRRERGRRGPVPGARGRGARGRARLRRAGARGGAGAGRRCCPGCARSSATTRTRAGAAPSRQDLGPEAPAARASGRCATPAEAVARAPAWSSRRSR